MGKNQDPGYILLRISWTNNTLWLWSDPVQSQKQDQGQIHWQKQDTRINSLANMQWSGSGMFIPDQNFFYPGYRTRIKEFKYFNPKKLFLSSRTYDPGCSSRTRILIFYPSWIPGPGVKKAPAFKQEKFSFFFSPVPGNMSISASGTGSPLLLLLLLLL